MLNSFAPVGRAECATVEQTQALGEQLGQAMQAGDVVILDGPLGAGKTTFVQGIARGMQVRGRVSSPTFIIAREHKPSGSGPALIHVDAYRLLEQGGDALGQLDALDLDTELDHAVIVAEWGGGLVENLAQSYLLIRINREAEDECRVFDWQVV